MTHKPPRFVSAINRAVNYNNFFDEDHFKEYHFWELYDPKKSYQTNLFEHDYGKGKRIYLLKFYTVWRFKYVNGKGWEPRFPTDYVVAEENISSKELQDLAKYCQCSNCTASSWFKTWFIKSHDHDCLKIDETIHASQRGIDRAREAKREVKL